MNTVLFSNATIGFSENLFQLIDYQSFFQVPETMRSHSLKQQDYLTTFLNSITWLYLKNDPKYIISM